MKILSKSLLTVTAISMLGACAHTPEADTLYERLGGDTGVTAIVHGTLVYTLADERIAHTFENSNVDRVEKLLIEQICDLTGGPCEYSGVSMERSHRGLNITSMHFNALVENMQKAMRDNDVPYRTQNQLIAILAPMHDDVVTGPPES